MSRLACIRVALMTAALVPALLSMACLAAPVGTLTIVDGDTQIVRDTVRFAAVEGLRVQADDIVITGADSRLLRVEFSDGRVLDLGGDSQALLQPRSLQGRVAAAYLARGWAKLTLPPQQTGAGLASPRLDLPRLTGVAVMHVKAERSFAFVESGQAEMVERKQGHAVRTVGLGEAESLVLNGPGNGPNNGPNNGQDAGQVLTRPNQHLLQGMPRALADRLPLRAARFAARPAAPGEAVPVAYADVALWINGEAAMRLVSVQRFAPLARQQPFRSALVAELRTHPEWTRVLFPDKASARAAAVARRGGTFPIDRPLAVANTPLIEAPVAATLAGAALERAH